MPAITAVPATSSAGRGREGVIARVSYPCTDPGSCSAALILVSVLLSRYGVNIKRPFAGDLAWRSVLALSQNDASDTVDSRKLKSGAFSWHGGRNQ